MFQNMWIFIIILASVVGILLILSVVQFIQISRLKKKVKSFTTGKSGANLEKTIISLVEDNKFLKNDVKSNRREINHIYKRLETTYQKMGLIKYDAFQQMGGQLSFSLALLDENNTGFIINSVHSTEGCYSYTKEIRNGTSAIDLSAEEAEALAMAMRNKE